MSNDKQKAKGKAIGFRLRNKESDLVVQWTEEQSNISDAIRYLVEKAIAEQMAVHGEIRDLSQEIPARRDLQRMIDEKKKELRPTPSQKPTYMEAQPLEQEEIITVKEPAAVHSQKANGEESIHSSGRENIKKKEELDSVNGDEDKEKSVPPKKKNTLYDDADNSIFKGL